MSRRLLSVFLNTALVALALFALGEILGVGDYISASTFTPSPEVAEIIASLKFTEKGERIIRATRPELETSADFNQNCSATSDDAYVLGCYNSKTDRLHLYNIQHKDLKGILESTAAHEMLHAVWDRLPFWERNSLIGELKSFYAGLPADSEIRKSMELYDGEVFYNELHSRLGTEVADLPKTLEDHYSNYFTDQDAVVAFYNAFHGNYEALNNELKVLKSQIDEISRTIEADSAEYDRQSAALDAKIKDFNSRINNLTEDEYNRERGAILAEMDALDAFYAKVNAEIDQYNVLVAEYNNSVLLQHEIVDSMDSNASPPTPSTNDILTDPALGF